MRGLAAASATASTHQLLTHDATGGRAGPRRRAPPICFAVASSIGMVTVTIAPTDGAKGPLDMLRLPCEWLSTAVAIQKK